MNKLVVAFLAGVFALGPASVKARYVAERHELVARYAEWEIIGTPELRRPLGAMFTPWR